MQAPPPGQYPPPPNGAGPRPSMPPTPIPAHAHPYYHQSPQRMSNDLSFPSFIQFTLHSSPSCPVSDDDAPAWWAWWPTSRLRWRTCSPCTHGRRCRPRMMQEVVSRCCLSVFFYFLLEGLVLCVHLRVPWLLVWRPRRLAWCSLALSHCFANAVRTPSMSSFDAPTPALVSTPIVCFPAKNVLQKVI